MFTIESDKTINITRGDNAEICIRALDMINNKGEKLSGFHPGEVIRLKVFEKKACENVVLQKDFSVEEETESLSLMLTEYDTRFGDVISKPVDYWYEIELNPYTEPQTIVGYDEDGAKIFRLYPEGKDVEFIPPTEEEIGTVDKALDLTSQRPIQNQAVARAVIELSATVKANGVKLDTASTDISSLKTKVDNLLSLPEGSTTADAELYDIRLGADGTVYGSAGEAVRKQFFENKQKIDDIEDEIEQNAELDAEYRTELRTELEKRLGVVPAEPELLLQIPLYMGYCYSNNAEDYADGDGKIAYSGARCTELIPLVDVQTFFISGRCGDNSYLIVEFDENQNFIRGIGKNEIGNGARVTDFEYVTWSDASFVAFSTLSGLLDVKVPPKRDTTFTDVAAELNVLNNEVTNIRTGVDEIAGRKTLRADYFQNGSLSSGSDIAYAIVLKKPIPVSSGDLIKVAPGNGYKVWYKLVNNEDLSVALNIYNSGNTTEESEYTATQDGWLVVQVSRVDGTTITPADYCCDISITNRKDDTEILTEVDVEAEHSNNQVYSAKAIDETLLAVEEALQIKQEALVSGKNIKTINGQSVLGEGDIVVEGGSAENVVPSANLATNPKRKTFTTIVNDCQNASDWEIANTSSDILSVDTANYILGSQSLHSDGQMKCTKNQYDLLNNDLVVKIKVNSIETGARLHLCVGSSFSGASNMVKYELARGCNWTTPSDWQEIAIPYTGTGYLTAPLDSIDFSKVDILTFNTEGGSADWNLQYVGTRPKTLSKGIITFTFDDGWDSQYTGVKLLAEKGITSTIFCIKKAVESGNYLTLEDFKKLVDYYGTDIEVHGDPSYDKWEEEDLKTHWSESQQFLKENGLGEGKHMAYPNGKYPENVVQLAKGYFDSCRTITPFIPLETYPLADRYRVRAVSGVGASNVTVNTVKKYIDRAMASGAWLILVFHKIGDGSDSMYCSETDLKAIADYAIASGAYIMNYAEVMESSVVNTSLGNISKALDGIIDIQNNLIGGAEG